MFKRAGVTLGTLVGETTSERHMRQLVSGLHAASDPLQKMVGNVERMLATLEDPRSSGYALSRDTTSAAAMRQVLARSNTGSVFLNEDLRALQRNWFFRRYFKEKARSR